MSRARYENWDPKTTGEYLGISPSTLAEWRMKGVGPSYIRAGRHVIYRRSSVDEWLESRAVNSTAEAKRLGAA